MKMKALTLAFARSVASRAVATHLNNSGSDYDDDAATEYMARRSAFLAASNAMSAPYGTTELDEDEETLNNW